MPQFRKRKELTSHARWDHKGWGCKLSVGPGWKLAFKVKKKDVDDEGVIAEHENQTKRKSGTLGSSKRDRSGGV